MRNFKIKTWFGILTALLLPTMVYAGIVVYDSSDVLLGTAADLKCGTGMTCTKSGKRVSMSSSPTLATALVLKAADTVDASITLQADNSDDSGDDWKINSVAASNLFTIGNDTSGSQVVKVSVNTSGDVFGPGTGKLYGFIVDDVAATATTITGAQCGKAFYNSGAVAINLPNGSAGLIGCRLTFFVANASNFDVNPGDSDQILTLTNAAGDAIRNATKGGSVVLQYGATNEWYVIGKEQGTWSDIN